MNGRAQGAEGRGNQRVQRPRQDRRDVISLADGHDAARRGARSVLPATPMITNAAR
jgi:hypothetical protein